MWVSIATPLKEVREGHSSNRDELNIHLGQVIAKTPPEDYRETTEERETFHRRGRR